MKRRRVQEVVAPILWPLKTTRENTLIRIINTHLTCTGPMVKSSPSRILIAAELIISPSESLSFLSLSLFVSIVAAAEESLWSLMSKQNLNFSFKFTLTRSHSIKDNYRIHWFTWETTVVTEWWSSTAVDKISQPINFPAGARVVSHNDDRRLSWVKKRSSVSWMKQPRLRNTIARWFHIFT